MSNSKQCGNCKFSKLTAVGPQKVLDMRCLRNPPQVVVMPVMTSQGPQAQMGSSWPPIQKDQWCGMYEAQVTLAS